MRSARGAVGLHVSADRTDLLADGNDLAYLEIALTDADGTTFTSAVRRITVTVTGPGALQGFGSADPRSTENFSDSTRTTFEGRALAVVRPLDVGTIVVTVSAEDAVPRAATRPSARPTKVGPSGPVTGAGGGPMRLAGDTEREGSLPERAAVVGASVAREHPRPPGLLPVAIATRRNAEAPMLGRSGDRVDGAGRSR